jgi:hypothetical protein
MARHQEGNWITHFRHPLRNMLVTVHFRTVSQNFATADKSVVGTMRKCRNLGVFPERGLDRLCHPPARHSRP